MSNMGLIFLYQWMLAPDEMFQKYTFWSQMVTYDPGNEARKEFIKHFTKQR